MKTAIITPLQEELTFLVAGLERFGLQKRKIQSINLDIFEFSEADLLVACGGHGKTQFGIQSQYLLCQFPQIERLICAGAAGALCDSLEIGDVVVATETVEHDYTLRFVSRPLPRFSGDLQVIETLKNLHQMNLEFSIYFGGIASGDEDIVDATRGTELMHLTDCIAVAWEGAGGARACKFNDKSYLEMRGITDTANHQAAVDFEVNLEKAMHNLARVIVQSIPML